VKQDTPKTHPKTAVHDKSGRRTIFKGASETVIAKQVKDAFAAMKRRPTPRAFDYRDPEVVSYERWMSGDN
jgi:hypothetical protein